MLLLRGWGPCWEVVVGSGQSRTDRSTAAQHMLCVGVIVDQALLLRLHAFQMCSVVFAFHTQLV